MLSLHAVKNRSHQQRGLASQEPGGVSVIRGSPKEKSTKRRVNKNLTPTRRTCFAVSLHRFFDLLLSFGHRRNKTYRAKQREQRQKQHSGDPRHEIYLLTVDWIQHLHRISPPRSTFVPSARPLEKIQRENEGIPAHPLCPERARLRQKVGETKRAADPPRRARGAQTSCCVTELVCSTGERILPSTT